MEENELCVCVCVCVCYVRGIAVFLVSTMYQKKRLFHKRAHDTTFFWFNVPENNDSTTKMFTDFLNPRIGIPCICKFAKMEVGAFLPTCRSSPMSVPRSNVWYVSPSLQAHGCWKCPFWRPEHFATLKSRKVQGSIFGSRAVWHLWDMDFSVNRLDRTPSPPRCHLEHRVHLTGCPTF